MNLGTRAAEHPVLLEGLNKAIADYYIVEGGSFQIRAQVARLRELVEKRKPKSIMEIGFNGGPFRASIPRKHTTRNQSR